MRIVSEVPLFKLRVLPADGLHGFNFFTMSIVPNCRKVREYLKLYIEAFPAYSKIKRLIILTSGCFLQANAYNPYAPE
jgi:hypothetical protein